MVLMKEKPGGATVDFFVFVFVFSFSGQTEPRTGPEHKIENADEVNADISYFMVEGRPARRSGGIGAGKVCAIVDGARRELRGRTVK